MKIGLDVDGVLADFNSGFRDLSRKLVGKPTDPNLQPLDWGMSNYGLTPEEDRLLWDTIGASNNFWVSLNPIATTTKLELLANSYDVTFITNRKVTQGLRVPVQTAIWLHSYFGLKYPTVVLAKNKGEVAKALGIDLFLDDNVDNCRDLAAHGIVTYLADASYNQECKDTNICRVADFDTFAVSLL